LNELRAKSHENGAEVQPIVSFLRGQSAIEDGDWEEGIAWIESAIHDADLHGATLRRRIEFRQNLAKALLERGFLEDALRYGDESLNLARAEPTLNTRFVRTSLLIRAQAYAQSEREAEALAAIERALAWHDPVNGSPREEARLLLMSAQLRFKLSSDESAREKAESEALRALSLLHGYDDVHAHRLRAEVERWLVQQGLS
jgi:tetratricopeptide (TPR) repeat protein